jgi:preprotein translocase subunit SecY
MLSALGNLFRVEEIRKRIFITVALLFLFRLGTAVPLPGVNYEAMDLYAKSQTDSGVISIVGVMSALSGGNLRVPVLFSLGILPYISASIIMSLLAKVLPSLEALAKEGAAGQRKINQYSRLLTVPLALVQGLVTALTTFRSLREPQNIESIGGSVVIIPDYGPAFYLTAAIGITAGTILLMWIGELVTEYGIGNGSSLIISIGIVADVPLAFYRILKDADVDRTKILSALLLAGAYLLIIIGVVYLHRGQRRVPMHQQRILRGKQMMGGSRHYLPIRLNMANVMPIIFASSLLSVPLTIASALKVQANWISQGSWLHVVLYAGLIVFFSYFWTSMMFQPTEIAENLKESGQFIPGIRPGKNTAEFLEKILSKVTLIGAFFVSIIAILPEILSRNLNVDWLVASFLGGTGIMIVVGVTLDIVDKLNSGLLMRNYEGFMGAAANKKSATAGRV